MAETGLSFYEQETIINYNQAEVIASVYTYDKSLMRALERYEQEEPDKVRKLHDHEWLVPKKWVTIRRPKQMKWTEEQRAERSERMREFRAKQLEEQRKSPAEEG